MWERQKNLQNIELYNLSWQVDTANVTKAIRKLEKLHEMRICPDGPAGLRHAHLILKNRAITSLHLDLRTLKPPMRDGEYNSTKGIRDGVTEILFQHLLPLESLAVPPLNLTRLTLWAVNLSSCAKTFLRTFNPASLKQLELVRCTRAGDFMHGLTGLSTPPRLESLVVAHYSTGAPGPTIVQGIGAYLKASATGCLKHLWVRLRGHEALPSATAIGRHGHSLERLSLDVCESPTRQGLSDSVVLRYRPKDVSQIMAHATARLRQVRLGFNYPAASALAALSAGGLSASLKAHLVSRLLSSTGHAATDRFLRRPRSGSVQTPSCSTLRASGDKPLMLSSTWQTSSKSFERLGQSTCS